MTDVESNRQAIQSPAPFSTWLGVVLLFVIFGVIVLAVVGPSPRGDTYEQSRAKNREEKLKALLGENTKTLTTYGWVDKNKGVVRIPVQHAMELTVAELAAKRPAPAYPIATPAAQPVATPSASASAAPSKGTPKSKAPASPPPASPISTKGP